jgi:hypothetical protein
MGAAATRRVRRAVLRTSPPFVTGVKALYAFADANDLLI